MQDAKDQRDDRTSSLGSQTGARSEEIVSLLNAILHTRGVEVSDKSVVSDAIAIYGADPIDFIDAWIVAFAKAAEVRTIYTFMASLFIKNGWRLGRIPAGIDLPLDPRCSPPVFSRPLPDRERYTLSRDQLQPRPYAFYFTSHMRPARGAVSL